MGRLPVDEGIGKLSIRLQRGCLSRSLRCCELFATASLSDWTDFPMSTQSRLAPGDAAPDFTLTDDTGTDVSLAGLRGGKVVVYFYPSAMTPGCTKQACDFSDSLDSLQAAGYTVLGISPDKPEKLAKFREKEEIGRAHV